MLADDVLFIKDDAFRIEEMLSVRRPLPTLEFQLMLYWATGVICWLMFD